MFPHKKDSDVLTVRDIENVKIDMNISNNMAQRMARDIRICKRKRNAIEPGLREHLSKSIHKLDDYFECAAMPLADKIQPIIVCNNLDGLIDRVKLERNVYPSANLIFKIGLDYGGGFLKTCLNVINTENHGVKRKRITYHEGHILNEFKDTSVNKLFIVTLTPENKETYSTIKTMWDVIDWSACTQRPADTMTVAADLKMANIMCGLMPHSATHPCAWCTVERYVTSALMIYHRYSYL